MKETFKFDLQLFAEGGEGSGENIDEGAKETAADTENQETPSGQMQTPKVGGDGENSQTLLGKTNSPAEEYDFKSIVPQGMEYNQEQADAFSAVAHDMNLSGEQAQKLAAYGMNYAGQIATAMNEAHKAEVQSWAEETKNTLGIDFDHTIQKAGAGLEALEKSIPNLRSALDYTGAGNRIEIIQALAMIGDLTREDNFRGFGANSGAVKSNIYGKTNFGLY